MQPGILELDLHGMNAYQAKTAVDAADLTLQTGRITALHSQPCDVAWGDELDRAWRRWNLSAPAFLRNTMSR